jgi:hypothetical protein
LRFPDPKQIRLQHDAAGDGHDKVVDVRRRGLFPVDRRGGIRMPDDLHARGRHMPIVGIVGPSCCGKSTVADLVASAIGARVLRLDAYWVSGSVRPIVGGEPSFERPDQYDGATLAADVVAHARARPDVPLVVEGFLILVYPALRALLDAAFFVEVPDAVLTERRTARSTVRGDASGGGKSAGSERAWAANGIEEWRRFGAQQALLPGVVAVDGTMPPAMVAASILSRCPGISPGAPAAPCAGKEALGALDMVDALGDPAHPAWRSPVLGPRLEAAEADAREMEVLGRGDARRAATVAMVAGWLSDGGK